MFTNSCFIEKFVWYSYSCQPFRPSYGCDLPSSLLNSVCRRYIRALVIRRLDIMDLLSIYKLYLRLHMCFWCAFKLLDLIYWVSVLPELSNFEDEILLKGGGSVTPGFLNSESKTQDNNFMNSWALWYWFNRLNFQIDRFVLYLFYKNYWL